MAKKKKIIDPRMCKNDPSGLGQHCWHSKVIDTVGNNIQPPQYKMVVLCCFCGVDNLSIHGPYHPDKYGKNTTTVVSPNSTGTPDWLKNSYTINATWEYEASTGTWVLKTKYDASSGL